MKFKKESKFQYGGYDPPFLMMEINDKNVIKY